MSIEELIKLKGEDYGKPDAFWKSVAAMWSEMIGKEITAKQAVTMMVIMKAKRAYNNPEHQDSWIDIQGYSKIGQDI